MSRIHLQPWVAKILTSLALGSALIAKHGFATSTDLSVRTSRYRVSTGESVTFFLTVSHPGVVTGKHLWIFGDILGDAVGRSAELSVEFEPKAQCEYFSESGKFNCDLGAPASSGETTLAMTVKTREVGSVEARGYFKLLSTQQAWASEIVQVIAQAPQ